MSKYVKDFLINKKLNFVRYLNDNNSWWMCGLRSHSKVRDQIADVIKMMSSVCFYFYFLLVNKDSHHTYENELKVVQAVLNFTFLNIRQK